MSTPIIICTATISYEMGSVACYASVAAASVLGPTSTQTMCAIKSADLGPGWTDEQLCAAVAAQLGVPAADVSVATVPVPAATPAPAETLLPSVVDDSPAPVAPSEGTLEESK